MFHVARATFFVTFLSKILVEVVKFASQIGALIAAYGWYTEQIVWMERGGATVAFAFLAGLALLAVLAAIWALATLVLYHMRRKRARVLRDVV